MFKELNGIDELRKYLKTCQPCISCKYMVCVGEDVEVILPSYKGEYRIRYPKNSLLCPPKVGSEGICETHACTPRGTIVLSEHNLFILKCSYNRTELSFTLMGGV